jgi:hypothetical protein
MSDRKSVHLMAVVRECPHPIACRTPKNRVASVEIEPRKPQHVLQAGTVLAIQQSPALRTGSTVKHIARPDTGSHPRISFAFSKSAAASGTSLASAPIPTACAPCVEKVGRLQIATLYSLALPLSVGDANISKLLGFLRSLLSSIELR